MSKLTTTTPSSRARSSARMYLAPVALLFACGACSDSSTKSLNRLASEPYLLEAGEVTHDQALERVNQQVFSSLERAADQPGSWMPRASAASYMQSRARLSGGLEDYLGALVQLSAAFDIAPEGGGPWLAQASLSFTLHRLDLAEAALNKAGAAVLIDDPTASSIEGLRGDIALQRGDMPVALTHLEQAEQLDPTSTSAARIGLWHWRSGDLERADEQYAIAASRYHGDSAEAHAWFDLQHGLLDLDRGRYDEALAHYLEANAKLSGYYLVEEHVAEVLALTGHPEQARFLYDQIVDKTDGPEFMDALAGLHQDAGDGETAQAWIESAQAAYEQKLEQLPEAAVGHALQHFIDYGPPQRALDLAQQNFALRANPGAESSLALAYLGAGELELAHDHALASLAGGWESFSLYENAAEVEAARGDMEASNALRTQACTFAPLRCDTP